jgi:hypothetical protein
MTLTRDELDHLAGRGGGTRLTKEELEQLPPEWREKVKQWPAFDQGKLSQLLAAQSAETAKLDAKIARKTAFLHKAAIRYRVREALMKAGAGKNVELLAPHVAERLRVVEQDGDIAGFEVLDREGKTRLRDGRPMRVEELINEVRRLPELEGLFTNGRHA